MNASERDDGCTEKTREYNLTGDQKSHEYESMDPQKTLEYNLEGAQKIDASKMTGAEKTREYNQTGDQKSHEYESTGAQNVQVDKSENHAYKPRQCKIRAYKTVHVSEGGR